MQYTLLKLLQLWDWWYLDNLITKKQYNKGTQHIFNLFWHNQID